MSIEKAESNTTPSLTYPDRGMFQRREFFWYDFNPLMWTASG
jgi:hypothetical protein